MTVPISVLRQSAAELLAMAILELFPETLLVGGESTDQGFYYDFLPSQPVNELALPLIEEKMRAIIKQNRPIKVMDMMRENASSMFLHRGQPLRADAISQSQDNIVEIFQVADFCDWCPGPFISETGEIAAFKIISIEEARHFFPEEGETSVLRLTGTVFREAAAFKKGVKAAEMAKRRDHRVLGREMELFSAKDEAGIGYWFWHPKGTLLRETILRLWEDELRQLGFQQIKTPLIVRTNLVKKGEGKGSIPAGTHSLEGSEYALRSGFTSLHALFYKSTLHSYREFPLRFAESGELFFERKRGQLWGLHKSRGVTGDISHQFCTPEQVGEGLISSLQFIDKIIKILGFEYRWYLSSRGQKFAGTLANWENGLDWMQKAFNTCGLSFTTELFSTTFAGPSAEARLIDSLGREWKGPKIEINFNCPERFGLRYQGPDDEMHVPIMLAMQTFFPSLDQLIAILIEHYNGIFPLWMAPEQVRILPIAERNIQYSEEIRDILVKETPRVYIDTRNDQLKTKIHAAEREKVPYILVIGDKEEKKKKVSVRSCSQNELISEVFLEDFIQTLQAQKLTENPK